MSIILLSVVLGGCTVGTEPPTPTTVVVVPPTTAPTLAPRSAATATVEPTTPASPTPSATSAPTITPTPAPTLTMAPTPTVEPTLTPQPTATTPPSAVAPRIVLERPVEGMFLQSPVEISGTVAANVGQIRASVQTPDGVDIGLPPVVLPTEPNGDGLRFEGTIPLGYAPTPRGVVIVVDYLDAEGNVAATAQQRANVEGRFARLQYLVVEAPKPYTRPADATLVVYGAAAGPPASVEVRLLDSADNVLQSATAALGWYQQGLPCDFSATLDNRPEAVAVDVVSLDATGQTLEHTRVPLSSR